MKRDKLMNDVDRLMQEIDHNPVIGILVGMVAGAIIWLAILILVP